MEQNLNTAWALALKNQKVIYGALKREHIFRTRLDWPDLVQEAHLAYVQAYAEFLKRKPVFELKAFNLFDFQAIRWRIRNLLHRDQWLTEHTQVALDAAPETGETLPALTLEFPEMSCWLKFILTALLPQLTQRQKVVLKQHLLAGQSLTDLASILSTSARTLRNDRQHIIAKALVLRDQV